jgi:glycosyltransferase involved in cell wall biosynthesis
MKILFLEAVQNFGGARKSTIELAHRLKRIGHDVLIVDFWGSCSSFTDEVNKNKINLKILDKRVEPIVLLSGNKFKFIVKTIFYLFYQIKLRRNFNKIVSEFSPDVISLNNTKCLSIVPKKINFEIQYIARGWFNFNSLPFIDRYIFKKQKKISYVTVCQSTRQAIYSGGFAKLEKIHVLTDVISNNLKVSSDILSKFDFWYNCDNRPFILHHCGGFLKTKGQHISLEVAKKLKENNIDFILNFTGIIYEGEESFRYYQNLVDQINSCGLKDNVNIVINPENIMDYFYGSDVLLLPSYTEGLPRVILEAMHFGKPVIANPVGGIIDVVLNNHTGFITDFNSITDYYYSIVDLFNNKQFYKKISQNCKNLINENYSDRNQELTIAKLFPLKN